jgi:hypothetical protein
MFEKKFAKKVRKYYKLSEGRGGRGGREGGREGGRVENCHSKAWGHQLRWWPQAINVLIFDTFKANHVSRRGGKIPMNGVDFASSKVDGVEINTFKGTIIDFENFNFNLKEA